MAKETELEVQLKADLLEANNNVSTLETENAGLADKVSTLETENANLTSKVETLEEEKTDLQTEVDTYKGVNEELSRKVGELSDIKMVKDGDLKQTPAHVGKTFTLDDVEYEFNYPKTTLNKVPITVDDVIADEELQRKLVDMKSGMVTPK